MSFSVFDVALLTSLPATGEMVTLDDNGVMTDFGEMVRSECKRKKRRS